MLGGAGVNGEPYKLTGRKSSIRQIACSTGLIHLIDHARRDTISRDDERYRVDSFCGRSEEGGRRKGQDEGECVCQDHCGYRSVCSGKLVDRCACVATTVDDSNDIIHEADDAEIADRTLFSK